LRLLPLQGRLLQLARRALGVALQAAALLGLPLLGLPQLLLGAQPGLGVLAQARGIAASR
jgi:hypothetical protein